MRSETGATPAAGATRRAILICGMHRSGTSAMARACNLLGCDLGRTVSGTAHDNPTGFWENAAVKQFNDEILARLGLAWDSVLTPPEWWWTADWAAGLRGRALAILAAEFGDAPLIAIKDPRMSRLLGFWLEVMREFGATPHVMVALRHPAEVAQSLARRNRMPRARAYLLWLWHTCDALAHAPAGHSCLVSYAGLLQHGKGSLDEAAALFGFEWPEATPDCEAAIAQFLAPTLRHHQAQRITPSFWKGLDAVVEAVYTGLAGAPVRATTGPVADAGVVDLARVVALLGGEEALKLATPART
jgi:hypothetical protein